MTQENLEKSLMKILVNSDHQLKIPTGEGFVLATRVDAIYTKLTDLLGYLPKEEEIKEAAKNLCNKKYLHASNVCGITFLAVSNLGKREYSC